VSQTELDFTWVLATQAPSTPAVTAVWVRLLERGTTWTVLGPTATATAFTGLTAATRYTFQVKVVHTGADGTFTSSVAHLSAKTLVTITPPGGITTTPWTIPPAPPMNPPTGQATTPAAPHTPCGTWWHWTLYDWTADSVGVSPLASGDLTGLGGIQVVGSFMTDATHVYEICYHTVTDDCHGGQTFGPDVCEWFNLTGVASLGYSGTVATFTATGWNPDVNDYDLVDSNPATSFRSILVASSNAVTSPARRDPGAWALTTPSSAVGDTQACLAWLVGGTVGDPGYGTVTVARFHHATPNGTGPYTAWIAHVAVACMEDDKAVTVTRILGGVYDLGDGIMRGPGYYLVRWSFPPGPVNPLDVHQLTFTATSGVSDAVDSGVVTFGMVRTGTDAVSIVLVADHMKPGAWIWGTAGVTVLQAPGSPGNTTYQSNLLWFDYTPSSGVVNHATGYALTPTPNQATGAGNQTGMTLERDPVTGYLWTAFGANLRQSATAGYERVTLDAQTYTAPYSAGWHGLLVGWDPVGRTGQKIVGLADDQNRLYPTINLSLTRHGGVTKLLFTGGVASGSPDSTAVLGSRTALCPAAVSYATLAGVYVPSTDTVTSFANLAGIVLGGLGIPNFRAAHWTGSRWMIEIGDYTTPFVPPAIVATVDDTGAAGRTSLPAVGTEPSAPYAVQAQAGGRPGNMAHGDDFWVVSRNNYGVHGILTLSRGRED
jgi:hypothetical protein